MNDLEARFCAEYLIDLDATAAALRAGYSLKRAETAAEWLKPGSGRYRPGLHEDVRRRQAERARRTGITAERVLREYARIAFANLSDILDFSDGARLREGVSRDDMAAVAAMKFKVSNGRVTDADVKLCDKMKALDVLARHLGMAEGGADGAGALPRIVTYADGSAEIDTGGEDGEAEAVE